MNPLFYRVKKMMTDSEARVAIREIISRHLEEGDPKRIHLEKLLDDPKRSIPIRGALESFPKKDKHPYTEKELKVIQDLLYLYG